MQETIEIPQGAHEALESWLGDRVGTVLQIWPTDQDGTLLVVLATVTADAFDEETDGYDVDSIELHMLTVYDTQQDGWAVSPDGEVKLGAVFGELANRYVNEDHGL